MFFFFLCGGKYIFFVFLLGNIIKDSRMYLFMEIKKGIYIYIYSKESVLLSFSLFIKERHQYWLVLGWYKYACAWLFRVEEETR